MMKKKQNKFVQFLKFVFSAIGCVLCLLVTVQAMTVFLLGSGESGKSGQSAKTSYALIDRFNTYVTNVVSESLDGVLSIKKVYWLSDDELVAPEPNQACYGETDQPEQMQKVLDAAVELLEGQDTLFSTDVTLMPGSKITYYLDETILAITWKEVIDKSVYTISEIKIAHPTQFRRFFAGGEYAAGTQYLVSEMAQSVNAVVAANGDFYGFRNMGIIINNGRLLRMDGEKMDMCMIDGNGDLRFVYAGQMMEEAEAQAYIDENGVRFSLAFGPILIDNGVIQNVERPYPVGSGFSKNARAALGQWDTLHYLLVTVSAEPPYQERHTLGEFSENLLELGCKKAYNLDGGQSATIVMNDKVMNHVYERKITDIIYFATALQNGE